MVYTVTIYLQLIRITSLQMTDNEPKWLHMLEKSYH